MSMGAALKAARVIEHAEHVLAIELLAAAQALDLLAPLSSSPPLVRVHGRIRARVPALVTDRPPARDIEHLAALIGSGALETAAGIGLQ